MDNINFLEENKKNAKKEKGPLAARMRPKNLKSYVGQNHMLDEGKPINRMLKANRISSMILYGPPGTGKTSLAYILAEESGMSYRQLSAVSASKADIMEVVKEAERHMSMYGEKTLLFIDEIHRFNKLQQDALLPHVEDGLIVLIGATTENPYFEVNKALLSRCHLIKLDPLTKDNLRQVINLALADSENGLGGLDINISDDAVDYLIDSSHNDARSLLNSLEIAALSSENNNGKINISLDDMRNSIIKKTAYYDKDGDTHYDTVSAFIKSMRGSDPDAAIYYLAKMIKAGEDIKFIARRIMILAAEDIGMADPNAINIASSTFTAIDAIGMPEARIILANAVIYMALAPKSNSSYMAIDTALDFIEKNGPMEIPPYLRDSHYSGAKEMGHGKNYLYPHNYSKGYVKQDYLPKAINNVKFYNDRKIGYETKINERLDKLKELGSEKDAD